MLETIRECRESARELKSRTRQHGQAGRQRFYRTVHRVLQDGEIDLERVSLSNLYEGFCGREALDELHPSNRGRGGFREAGNAVDTSDFSNITGQITYSTVMQALEAPAFIARGLVSTEKAETQYKEIVPGVAMIGDKAEDVAEGENYPRVGLGEEWITVPEKIKDGFILPITEEAIWEDKTGGLLMRRANAAAESMGITQEKQGLDVILGNTNSYERKGVARDTYSDTGGFDNLTDQALNDYTDIKAALDLFDAITDPNTGEPIDISGTLDILHPTALELQMLAVIEPLQIKLGADSGAVQTLVGNLLQQQKRRQFNVIPPTQYIKQRSESDAEWWIGKFNKAFAYREIWPIQVFRQDRNSEAGFATDVVTQVKVRRRGVFYVKEPRYVVMSTGAS